MARFLVLILAPIAVGLALPPSASAFELKRTDSGQPIRWHERTVRIRIAAELPPSVSRAQLERAVAIAADAWRGRPGVPRIVIEDAPAAPLGREGVDSANGVYVPTPWPHDPDRITATETSHDGRGRLLDVDILLNGAHPLALLEDPSAREGARGKPPDAGPPGGGRAHAGGEVPYDLANVLTHEFGHVLGLANSRDGPNATMWSDVHRGETRKRTLAPDDEAGITQLYADRAQSGCGGSASVAGPAAPSAALPLLFAFGGLLIARRRARARAGAGNSSW